MRKLKWGLVGLAALVVGVVVAGYVVLSTIDFEDYRAEIQAEAKKATGRDLVIAGPIDLKISLTPAIELEKVSFANAPWGSRPDMVTLERFEVEVALMPLFSGNIDIRRLIVVKPDILLETDAQGRGNWDLEGLKTAAEATAEAQAEGKAEAGFAGLPILHQVVIEDGRLTYRDGTTGAEMRVDLNSLTAKAGGPTQPLGFQLDGAYNGSSFKLSGSLGSVAQLMAGPFPIDLTAEAGGAEVTVKGAVAQPQSGQGIDLKITAKGESLADIGALAGAPLPPLGPYEVALRVKPDGETVSVTELAAKIGASDLSGQASLALGGARPALSGVLASQHLDLADFAPEGEGAPAAAAAPAAPASPYVFTEDPLPLDALKAADAELKLTVATLRLQEKMALQDLDLTLALTGGRLKVAPLLTTFSDGKIRTDLDLDAGKATPTLSLAVTGAGIDYGKLLKEMAVIDDVRGTLDMSIDLAGAGGSMRQIAAGLSGKTDIASNEGVISNKLLKLLGVGLSDMMGPLMGGDEDAKLNCILSRFDIKKGLATSQALVFDSESFTVTGTGTVDLKTERLELQMDTATRQASLASLAVPFNVGGTLKEPSFTPDPVGTALGAAKVVGMFVAPPLAIGELIAERTVSDGGNPCVAAVDAVARGEVPAEEPPKSTLETITEQPETILEEPGKALKGVGEGLKDLFGG